MKLRTISVPIRKPGEPPRNHTAAAMDSAVTGALVRAWKAAGGEVPEAEPAGTEVVSMDEESGIITTGTSVHSS